MTAEVFFAETSVKPFLVKKFGRNYIWIIRHVKIQALLNIVYTFSFPLSSLGNWFSNHFN